MNSLTIFFVCLLLGYYVFLIFSHPQKKKHKVPRIAFWRFQILPNFKFHCRNKTYHIHHWLILLIPTALIFYFEGFSSLLPVKAVAIGGIIQGLRFPDRFKFTHPPLPENKESISKM